MATRWMRVFFSLLALGSQATAQDQETCEACKKVVEILEDYVVSGVAGDILEDLDVICGVLDEEYLDECKDFIRENLDDIIEWTEQDMNEEEICTMLDACAGEGPTSSTKPKPTSSNTPGPTPTHTPGDESYYQVYLKGEGPVAHPHEGGRLHDLSGWVAIGQVLPEDERAFKHQIMLRRVNNDGNTVWTTRIGESCPPGLEECNVGFSVAVSDTVLYAGVGLASGGKMKPAVLALNVADGSEAWRVVLEPGSGHGGVRSVVVDGEDLLCTGYTDAPDSGFQFVVDEGKAKVWKISTGGELKAETTLGVEELSQGAKIRVDGVNGGYVVTSTAWGVTGAGETNVVVLVKLSRSLDIEWSKAYGDDRGASQVFDMLVDHEGNYLMGGHTTGGEGVVNWDYLAVKVNSKTQQVEWRKTFGQPRGFDARYIHDEMYGVGLDAAGNYVLLGGSGDEYSYSETHPDGWSSDVWVSYMVVVNPQGTVLTEGVYGSKEGNNAGEYLSVCHITGEIMIYTDSDTAPGFGFLLLRPNN